MPSAPCPILIPAIGPELGGDEQSTIEALDRLLDTLDGVLLTGSPSNVEPHHYGGEQSRERHRARSGARRHHAAA